MASNQEITMDDDGSLVSKLIEEYRKSATQLEDLNRLMNSMKDRMGSLSYYNLNDWSIYRVPSRLRELNKDAYIPRIVSIGPFHYGQEKLQDMEAHKTWYMMSLIQRTTDPNLTFSECCKAILSVEESARDCYYCEDDQNLGPLAEILLVDGCFILELFLRCWDSTENSTHDPIFGGVSKTYCLQRDLALLENQIPFFVLERLFEVVMARIKRQPLSYFLQREPHDQYPLSLNLLCSSFFSSALNPKQDVAPENSKWCHGRQHYHLLDVMRSYYLPSYSKAKPKYKPKSKHKQSGEFIHCVTQLRECGIKFVKGTSENLFDIKFSSKGVLEIPWLYIHDNTDSLLRNLIAFEQCCGRTTSYEISSYACLMDRLIDSPSDAELLQRKEIITNHLGSGEDVSELFNKICKEVIVEDFFFAALCQQINEFSNLWWPKRREIFVRDYCSSPWKFIGIIVGSALLLLTVFQTGYTIASYYHH